MDVREQLALCEALLRDSSDLLDKPPPPLPQPHALASAAPKSLQSSERAVPARSSREASDAGGAHKAAHKAAPEEEARHLWLRVINSWAGAARLRVTNFADAERFAPQCFRASASHTCSSGCKWESLSYGTRFRDPLQESRLGDAAPLLRANGDVFLCAHSGAVHHCDGEQCGAYLTIDNGSFVCRISGVKVGEAVPNASRRAPRNLLHSASFGRRAPATVDAFVGPKTGEAATKTRETVGVKRPAAAAFVDDAALDASLLLPPPTRRTSKRRYAPGSVAERMQLRSEGGRNCREPEYDRHLVAFSFDSLTEAQRNAARLFCDTLLFSPTVASLFQRRQQDALRNANQYATRYVNKCIQRGYLDETNFHMFVSSIYRQMMDPLIEGVFLRIYCTREDETLARRYFSEAVVRTWKIIEATPYCCEAETFSGGATAKKRCSHTHLKKLAPAILYLLHSGLRQQVSYHRVTRRVVFTSESDPPPSGPEVVTETVTFVPPHRYLWRLPEESQLRSIDFSTALANGSAALLYESANKSLAAASASANAASYDPELIATQRRILACYRSLLSIQPPLTIEAVRNYRLEEHIAIMDSDPSTGRFVQVANDGGGDAPPASNGGA